MLKNALAFIIELVKIVLISLVIIIPIRYFLIQPFYVKGASMEPNFYDREYLIIDEISYRLGKPERGDIVVFRYPLDPQEYFIKRLIGLPGESVQIKGGNVIVYNEQNPNGVFADEYYLPEDLKTYGLSEDKVNLGEDQYFVLGDNRGSSKDSRSFGTVDKSFIVGKVLLRGLPFSRAQFFEAPQYGF